MSPSRAAPLRAVSLTLLLALLLASSCFATSNSAADAAGSGDKAASTSIDPRLKGQGPKGQDLNQLPLDIPASQMTPEQKLVDWVIRDRGMVSVHST